MLSVKVQPAWKLSVAEYAEAAIAQYESACNLSDQEAERLVAFFQTKPRTCKPLVMALPSRDQINTEQFGKLLENFVDSSNPANALPEPDDLPKVIIDQAVLLNIACMTALSPDYEFRAFLGITRDEATSNLTICHVAVAPGQKVKGISINSETRFSQVIPAMARTLGISETEMYSLLHGDFHTHVRGDALPSDKDLFLSQALACGDWDDLKLLEVNWSPWWVGIISNLQGHLYVYLFDVEKRRFIRDLSWEVKPIAGDPVLWVKQRLAPLLREMQREVVLGNYTGEPDGLDEHEPETQDVLIWGDDEAKPIVSQDAVDTVTPDTGVPPASPAAKTHTARPSRRRRSVRTLLAATLILVLGIGLYAMYGELLHPGQSSTLAVVGNPAGTSEVVPVGTTPAAAPDPQTSSSPKPEVGPTTVAIAPVTEPPPNPVTPGEVAVSKPVASLPLATVPTPAVEPVGSTAPKAVTASAAPAKGQVASVPKPEPLLEPWQQKLVDEYQGLTPLPQVPQQIDMEQWKNVPTETLRRFANFTWQDYERWFDRASASAISRVQQEVGFAFLSQSGSANSVGLVRRCLNSLPSPSCIGIDRTQMEALVKDAATYLGDEAKPLAAIYRMRLRQEGKRR